MTKNMFYAVTTKLKFDQKTALPIDLPILQIYIKVIALAIVNVNLIIIEHNVGSDYQVS